MISLSKFLKAGSASETETDGESYVRALKLLIHGIELHTLEHTKDEYDAFRTEVAALSEQITFETASPEVLANVTEIIKTFESYNRKTSAGMTLQMTELQGIISTCSGAITRMSSASGNLIGKLKEIQSKLGVTENVADLRALKSRLSECLDEIAVEAEAHRTQSNASMDILSSEAQVFNAQTKNMQRKVTIDPTTGLPMRAHAEPALARAADGTVSAVAVAFALKRLNQVNLRFGFEMGDRLLVRLTSYLGTELKPEGGLFRWNGPSLLAIIKKNVAADRINMDVKRLVSAIPQNEVTIGGRVALIPINVGWALFPIVQPIEKLVRQIDAFVQSQASDETPVQR